jgi:hypothetical protein
MVGGLIGVLAASEATAQTVAGVTITFPEATDARQATPAWGTTAESLYNVNAFAFDSLASGFSWQTGDGFSRYLTSGDEWIAGLTLPSGALITGIEIQGCDSSATGRLLVALVRQEINDGFEAVSLVGSILHTGGPETPGCGNFTETFATPVTVANENAGYFIDVQQGGATDGSVRFMAVRVRYRLQVSPSPGSATFGDVPTSHVYFRAIEALAASGITRGCGGGNFCPNGNVTRGELAVFLARALGLHWPL